MHLQNKNTIVIRVLIWSIGLFVFGCASKEGAKQESIPLQTKKEKEVVEKPIVQESRKKKLDSIYRNCNCPAPYKNAPVQMKIAYGVHWVKLCTFIFDQNSKEINEFQVFDENDRLVAEGFPHASYQLMQSAAPITIRQFNYLPGANGGMEQYASFDMVVNQMEQGFELDHRQLYNAPNMDQTKQDSILNIYQQLQLGQDTTGTASFVLEKYIRQLFVCAFQKNTECLEAFENLENTLALDGGTGTEYSELKKVLQVWKQNRKE